MSGQHQSAAEREYSRLLEQFGTGTELLQEAEVHFRLLVETIPGVAYIAEPGEHGSWLYISPGLQELLGYDPGEWLADSSAWIELMHPVDRARVLADEASWDETTGGVHVGEYRLRGFDGRYRWVRDAATARPKPGAGHKALWFGVLTDVTESREAQEALRHSEQLLRSVLETAQDAFVAFDAGGAVLDWNRRAETMFGRRRADVLGRELTALVIPERLRAAHPLRMEGPVVTSAPDAPGAPLETIAMRADGTEFPTELTSWTTSSGDGERHNVFIRDITERQQLQDELRTLAFSDALTGLPNRALFADLVEQALVAHRPAHSIAVLFLDVDDFKTVNDSLGHPAGDRLLRIVAERVRAVVRATDVVARLAGDEFAVLLHDVERPQDAVAIARAINHALRVPLVLDGRRTFVSASIGVACAVTGSAVSAQDLLRDADAAMYHAKRSGKDTSVVHDPVMHSAALARLDLKADLQLALAADQLFLVFQPYFVMHGGRLAGFEALIRWNHPVRGLVPPTEFIPLAEETALMHLIGDWVLREACRQAERWPADRAGERAPSVNVNVSAMQLQEPGLVERVESALHASGLLPQRLVLEITEGMLLHRVDQAVLTLQRLRALGVRIAVDDFGTGYSSLSYLQHLPIDVLKIDKSFVDGLGVGQDETSMAKVVLQIARTLQLAVVAEGVENCEQEQTLRELGCDFAQGFLLGKPMSAADAAALAVDRGPVDSEGDGAYPPRGHVTYLPRS